MEDYQIQLDSIISGDDLDKQFISRNRK